MTGRISELAGRLDLLIAVEEIRQVKARYWRAIDAGDLDAVADCLTDDVEIDFQGMEPAGDRASFLAQLRAAAHPGAYHVHHGHNPEIWLTGPEAAEGRWDVHYMGIVLGPRILIDMAGAYEDQYARADGRWRIRRMRMRQTSFLSRAVGEDGTTQVVGWPGEAALAIEAQSQREDV